MEAEVWLVADCVAATKTSVFYYSTGMNIYNQLDCFDLFEDI